MLGVSVGWVRCIEHGEDSSSIISVQDRAGAAYAG